MAKIAGVSNGAARAAVIDMGAWRGGDRTNAPEALVQQAQVEAEQLWLFEPGVDMAKLRAVRGALLKRPGSASSVRAYEGDWADFAAWCKSAGRSALPATAETMELYVVDAAGRGQSMNTLRRRLTGIRVVHRASRLAVPDAAGARKLLRELARDGHGAAKPKRAVSVDELGRMVGRCDATDPRGARDRALLLLGFASGLRRSELVGLDVCDLRWVRSGLELTITRSKTDQQRQGRIVPIWPAKRPALCPIRALKAWLRMRGKWDGPVFVGWRGGEMQRVRLYSGTVSDIVQARAAEAGLDPALYGGHSLRAGCVTAAIVAGASLSTVMARTGHRAIATLQRYYRPANAWAAGDPLRGAL